MIAAGETRSNGDVFLYDVRDDQLFVVSRDPADESATTWSEDGRLAWLAVPKGGDSVIRLTNVDAPGTTFTLPGSGLAGAPNSLAWSPTSLELYGSNADKTALIVVPVNGSAAPIVIAHAAGQGMPSWQP